MNYTEPNNTILVDKPIHVRSTKVVYEIKKKYNFKKVGHAGTLDPLATGLLVICTGDNTKLISNFIDYDKEYICTMKLGETTLSFDAETKIETTNDYSAITVKQLEETFKTFEGNQLQTPPMYSALKYAGKPLYEYARKGKTVLRSKRDVTIHKLELKKYELPFVTFSLRCSKGTYVRTLVHDIGQILNCGAYVVELRRTKVGPFEIENALPFINLSRTKVAESIS